MTWLLLVDQPESAARNMAVDSALLEAAEGGLCALRLYRWGPPALSFGRNEPALKRYDRAAIASRGLSTVRRPTGGRAVWHDREVTYAVAAPAATFGSLRDTYHEIHAMLADALRGLGAAVTLAADRPAAGVGAGACFASAAGGEVLAPDGRKVVGSAQVRSGEAFLQHGSILLEPAQHIVAELTMGIADPPSPAGLAELVPPGSADWGAVCAAVARTAARRWNSPATAAGLPDEVRRRAGTLEERFANDAWTWRR